jgi:hypothetical protein
MIKYFIVVYFVYQQTSGSMPGLNENFKLQASQKMTTRLKAQAII